MYEVCVVLEEVFMLFVNSFIGVEEVAKAEADERTNIANLVFTKTREAEQGARTIQLLAEKTIPIFRNYTKTVPERRVYGFNS